MARSRASVPDVKFGLLLELGSLAVSVEVELPPLLVLDEVVVLGEVVELDEGVKVPDGMSDPGTAEIGAPAWDPAAGLRRITSIERMVERSEGERTGRMSTGSRYSAQSCMSTVPCPSSRQMHTHRRPGSCSLHFNDTFKFGLTQRKDESERASRKYALK